MGDMSGDEMGGAVRKPPLPLATHLLAVAGYVALTLALTYPIAFKLFSEVPGGGDAWQHIWNLWWVKEALLNLHTNPYHTGLLYYPEGVNLYFHTLVLTAGLIGIPLQLLGFNLIATYNIILLSTFVLAGYGAFLLCHYLTGSKWAAFAGGAAFAFCPYHFAHMYGHMNLASLQWIPFYVVVLLKAVDAAGALRNAEEGAKRVGITRKALLYAAGAGALLALNTYTDWLYGIFLALFTGLLLAWRLLMPSERGLFAQKGIGWMDGLMRLAVGGGLYLLLVSLILFPTLAEVSKGYAQQPPYEILVYSSDATLAFLPSQLHPLWGPASRAAVPLQNPSEKIVFLGFSVLALAAFACWKLRGNRQVHFWGFIALATWVLSLGPVLQFFGRSRFTDFEVAVPLPYLLLYKLPFLSIMRTPTRLAVLTMLALAVLVAYAVMLLLQRLDRHATEAKAGSMDWRQAALSLGVSAVILFEFLAIPFPTVPPGWNVPIYSKIAQEPGRFAILELPLRLSFGDYLAYQTVHGKPIIGGYLSRQPPYPTLERVPALRYLLDATSPDDPIRSQIIDGAGVRSLRDIGVKYVIIRWWAFTPDQRTIMEAKLGALLGRAPDISYSEHQVAVWQIAP
jgi:hypothetical protein